MTIQLYGMEIRLARRDDRPALVRHSDGLFVLACNALNAKETFLVPIADLPL